MRAAILSAVLLAVGCGNEPITQTKSSTGQKQLVQDGLEKWQGEWVSTKDSPVLKMKISNDKVQFLDVDRLFAVSLEGKLATDFRIRLLPRKTNDFYQFDLVYKSKTVYRGICIYRNDGSIELSMHSFGPRPTEMGESVIIQKKR